MVGGATWTDRQPTDWLASNGRWYPSSAYPRGWASTALPPAPGQGGVTSLLKKYTDLASGVQSDLTSRVSAGNDGDDYASGFDTGEDVWSTPRREPPRTKTPPPPPGRTAPPPPSASSFSGFSVEKSGRSMADATVEEQKTYAHPVGTGAASPGELPPPPPDDSSAPAKNAVVKKAPPSTTAAAAATSFNVIAGDFGKVLGGAKERIERAINDAYEGQ